MKRAGLVPGLVAWLALAAPAQPQAPATAPGTGNPAPPGIQGLPGLQVDTGASGSRAAPILEPYRFNARERTARALAAWEQGRSQEAVAPLDSALRLRPGDPLVEYNAGTAHLGAKQSDAGDLLEQAAKHAPAGLAPDVFYNLGNARLEAKDAAAAVEAYKSALRLQPELPNAKRNLELALRMLAEQKKQQEQQKKDQQKKDQQEKNQQGQDQQQKGAPDEQQKQGREQQSPQGRNPDPQHPDPGQKPPEPGQGDPRQGGEPQKDRPLPQFQDQKDMTAEQAAAILQAVENLERQQRRDQARALARAKTSVEKDW